MDRESIPQTGLIILGRKTSPLQTSTFPLVEPDPEQRSNTIALNAQAVCVCSQKSRADCSKLASQLNKTENFVAAS